ncbi:carboxymuconolactone decarboxylase family protein [Aeromicrobium alkaliterrae]|uniref:Carboxymuconolactone decarboxylase family protein n=1 Tax=Aeromicrobium alkaliterrae TaxID=302168 RepID=A0ABP4VRY4_9ACTN
MDETPRIAPGGLRELGLVNHGISTLAGKVVGGPRPNIFTTLGRQRGLFRAWLWYSGRLMPGGKLPRRETELVILHVASTRECAYELNHHRRIGRRVGLTREQVEHAGDRAWSGWSSRERALLEAAHQFVTTRDIDDAAWATLRDHLDEATAIEFCLLCGQYDSLATTLMTLRVQPEA